MIFAPILYPLDPGNLSLSLHPNSVDPATITRNIVTTERLCFR